MDLSKGFHLVPYDKSMGKYLIALLIEGSLEVKLPTQRTDEKHSQEEAEPGRNSDVEKVRREKIRDGVDGEKWAERRCRCTKR